MAHKEASGNQEQGKQNSCKKLEGSREEKESNRSLLKLQQLGCLIKSRNAFPGFPGGNGSSFTALAFALRSTREASARPKPTAAPRYPKPPRVLPSQLRAAGGPREGSAGL